MRERTRVAFKLRGNNTIANMIREIQLVGPSLDNISRKELSSLLLNIVENTVPAELGSLHASFSPGNSLTIVQQNESQELDINYHPILEEYREGLEKIRQEETPKKRIDMRKTLFSNCFLSAATIAKSTANEKTGRTFDNFVLVKLGSTNTFPLKGSDVDFMGIFSGSHSEKAYMEIFLEEIRRIGEKIGLPFHNIPRTCSKSHLLAINIDEMEGPSGHLFRTSLTMRDVLLNMQPVIGIGSPKLFDVFVAVAEKYGHSSRMDFFTRATELYWLEKASQHNDASLINRAKNVRRRINKLFAMARISYPLIPAFTSEKSETTLIGNDLISQEEVIKANNALGFANQVIEAASMKADCRDDKEIWEFCGFNNPDDFITAFDNYEAFAFMLLKRILNKYPFYYGFLKGFHLMFDIYIKARMRFKSLLNLGAGVALIIRNESME